MREFVRNNLNTIEWILGALAVILPLIAWLGRVDLSDLTINDIFPPLGLIAFGVMWTHFVVGALKRYGGVIKKEKSLYLPISMGLVLALILLHPALFYISLYLDGYGLPPQSYMEAYSTQIVFITLGIVGLLVFLSYELKRFFGNKSWWKIIERLQIVGMIAIYIHALNLGSDLQMDWFMIVWIIYGITFAIAVTYSLYREFHKGAVRGA